jgi:plasmid stabilization system protein ParE
MVRKIADKFVDELLVKIKTLSIQPSMGMASRNVPAVRSIKISKHNRLYYRIENDKLVLLNIFDTRQHPDKNLYS